MKRGKFKISVLGFGEKGKSIIEKFKREKTDIELVLFNDNMLFNNDSLVDSDLIFICGDILSYIDKFENLSLNNNIKVCFFEIDEISKFSKADKLELLNNLRSKMNTLVLVENYDEHLILDFILSIYKIIRLPSLISLDICDLKKVFSEGKIGVIGSSAIKNKEPISNLFDFKNNILKDYKISNLRYFFHVFCCEHNSHIEDIDLIQKYFEQHLGGNKVDEFGVWSAQTGFEGYKVMYFYGGDVDIADKLRDISNQNK